MRALCAKRVGAAVIRNPAQVDMLEGGEEDGVGATVSEPIEVMRPGKRPSSATAALLTTLLVYPLTLAAKAAEEAHAMLNAVSIATDGGTSNNTSNNTTSGGLVMHHMTTIWMQVQVVGLPVSGKYTQDSNILELTMLVVALYMLLLEAMFLGPAAAGLVRRLVSDSTTLGWINPDNAMPIHDLWLVQNLISIARGIMLELEKRGVRVLLVWQPAHGHPTDKDGHDNRSADRCAGKVDSSKSTTWTHVVDVSGLHTMLHPAELLTKLDVTPRLCSIWEQPAVVSQCGAKEMAWVKQLLANAAAAKSAAAAAAAPSISRKRARTALEDSDAGSEGSEPRVRDTAMAVDS